MGKEEEQRGKELLDEYYKAVNACDKMAVADALEKMKKIAENLVDYITDIIYWE